jgi:hypothetical protein
MCLFSEFRVVMSVAISAYLLYLCLFTHSGVQHLFLRHVPYVASFSGLSFFLLPFDILWRLFAPSHDVVSVHDSIYTCMIIEISSWIILCILAIFHFRVYNYIEHIIIYSSGKTEDYLRIWINISSSNLFPNRTNYFEFICIYIVKYCNSVLNWLIKYV